MPDVSGLYPQPPQPGQGFLTGDPSRTIGALEGMQRLQILQQQAPALEQQSAATLQGTQLENQRRQIELQNSLRHQLFSTTVGFLSPKTDKSGNSVPTTDNDVANAVTNAVRLVPAAAGMGGDIQGILMQPGAGGKLDIDANVRSARSSLLPPEIATQRVPTIQPGTGAGSTMSGAEAVTRGGNIPTELSPVGKASTAAYTTDLAQARDYKNKSLALENLMPLLRQVGQLGLTSGIRQKFAEIGVALGANDDEAALREKINKYMVQNYMTGATGDTSTDLKTLQSISGNPNINLVTSANIDLGRTLLSRLRASQAQTLEMQKPTPTSDTADQTGRMLPEEIAKRQQTNYLPWSSEFNTKQDLRGYVMDQYTPKERSALTSQVSADLKSNDPERKAAAQRFFDSYRIAKSHPGLMKPLLNAE